MTDDIYLKQETRASFLEKKPHVKGIINSITFMPWKDTRFVTGGSDHAVFLWSEKDGENPWKHKVLHRSMHSSAVMGVAGLQQKTTVLSVGADKRIVGFDVASERAGYKHQIESKCMSVVPNPCDFNLFMVQTGYVINIFVQPQVFSGTFFFFFIISSGNKVQSHSTCLNNTFLLHSYGHL